MKNTITAILYIVVGIIAAAAWALMLTAIVTAPILVMFLGRL